MTFDEWWAVVNADRHYTFQDERLARIAWAAAYDRGYGDGVAAERERCAMLADELAARKWAAYKTGSVMDRANPHTEGQADGAEMVADSIRNGAS